MITIVIITIIISYLILIGCLVYGFDKVDDFILQDLEPKTKFTVVIPFRNESENLREIMSSIFRLNYPKTMFEIILVDDDSSDNSVELVNTFIAKPSHKDSKFSQKNKVDITVTKNKRVSNSPKKDAITTAVAIAKYEWIVTTDADCILPKYWLDAFDELIQTQNPNCIVAPVSYIGTSSFFNRFQTLDFLSLQGATIGGFGLKKPFLANGANFGYKTLIFEDIGGFDGNENVASGDDVFLLEKFKQLDSKKVIYLKSQLATVTTKPVKSFEHLIQQRLRWASKTSHNPNSFSKLAGLIVFLGNLACIVIMLLMLIQLLEAKTAVALLVIKVSIDFLLLFKTTRFFKQESILISYLSSAIYYPFFNIYIVTLSLFNSYTWKERRFRR